MIIVPPEESKKCHEAKICCCPKRKPRYCQPPIPKSFAPRLVYQQPCTAMQGDTVYTLSYQATVQEKQKLATIPPDNLTVSQGKMAQETVYRMSYLPICLPKVMQAQVCDHDLFGRGPMQDLTSYKHDFVPQPYSRRKPCSMPRANIMCSNKQMDDSTIYRMSYPPPDRQARQRSYAPEVSYAPPAGCMDFTTVYSMSYQPNDVVKRPDLRWTKNQSTLWSNRPFVGDTVYRMSYMAPGQECEDVHDCTVGCDCSCRKYA